MPEGKKKRKMTPKERLSKKLDYTPWPEAIKEGWNKTVSDVKGLGKKVTEPVRRAARKVSNAGGKYKQAAKEGNLGRTLRSDLPKGPDLIKARQNITKAGGAKPYLGRKK
jgi:hypothetical protein